MLYSQGVPMEDLGVPTVDGTPVETDHRRVWHRLCENFHLFRATPTGLWLSDELVNRIFARALSGESGSEDAARFTANVLVEMAGMSVEDGLVMQLHAGSLRNHNRAVHRRFGPDAGADISIAADWTGGLRALLDEWGNDRRFRLVVFGLDEAAHSRELAPLAGHYPVLLLGAPWWFFDSPLGMRRYLDAVMETAGLYNTAGFNDDTRAFASIPSRHDVWRRITCDWLAGMVLTGLGDEEEAPYMAREFAYGLAKKAYGFQKEPVGRA